LFQVKKLTPAIIFIFGGPGSRKGPIVDNLVCKYGAKHVSIDDILRKPRPKIIVNERALDNQQFLEGFNMQKLLSVLTDVVDNNNKDAIHVFDIIPNLKVLAGNSVLWLHFCPKCTEAGALCGHLIRYTCQ
jgi:adenylate kinase family enzyme